MKKLTCILAVMLMLCLCTIAYAADPVTLDITALDYQTGKAVSKTYVNNELFLLKVDIGIPRFFDLTDMELIIDLDGVELDTNDLRLEAGTYYLSGIVTDQPAALRITVKDKAYDNATTAEELYNALQQDRTVSKTYYFNAAQPAEQPIAKNPVVIPKTLFSDTTAFAFITSARMLVAVRSSNPWAGMTALSAATSTPAAQATGTATAGWICYGTRFRQSPITLLLPGMCGYGKAPPPPTPSLVWRKRERSS